MIAVAFVDELSALSRQPEYLHVLLHGFPIYGVMLGVISLLIALAMKSRPAQVIALWVLFLSAATTYPVFELGEKAEDRVEGLADGPGKEWVREHGRRADTGVIVLYCTAGLALAGIVVPKLIPGATTLLTVLALAGGIAGSGAGVWVARAGGQIRHKEFRTGEPPPETHKSEHRKEKSISHS